MKAILTTAATVATPHRSASSARAETEAAKRHRFDKTASTTTTWLTPQAWVAALGPFDLDPCTPPVMPWRTAKRMLTEKDDGLSTKWPKPDFVFHNPPYGRGQDRWMQKAAEHGNGISLVLNRADTKWFRDWVLKHPATTALLFIEGRVKFCTGDGKPSKLTCPVPAVFVAYGALAAERLRQANAAGVISGVFFRIVHAPVPLLEMASFTAIGCSKPCPSARKEAREVDASNSAKKVPSYRSDTERTIEKSKAGRDKGQGGQPWQARAQC